MDHLCREFAPISEPAWRAIDHEAERTLRRTLAARRILDLSGPQGWRFSAVDLGRTRQIGGSSDAVEAAVRETQPLVEHRVPFTLSRCELEAIDRGATDADLSPVVQAAQNAAAAEDRAVFDGVEAAGLKGLLGLGKEQELALTDDYEQYPEVVASALASLRQNGVAGPYLIALGPRCYQGLTETTNAGGYPIMNLVQQQVENPFVWAPTLDGALVVSTRGGDFELKVGQDFSIGYRRHDDAQVELYVEESFTFIGRTSEALVPLRYESPRKRK